MEESGIDLLSLHRGHAEIERTRAGLSKENRISRSKYARYIRHHPIKVIHSVINPVPLQAV